MDLTTITNPTRPASRVTRTFDRPLRRADLPLLGVAPDRRWTLTADGAVVSDDQEIPEDAHQLIAIATPEGVEIGTLIVQAIIGAVVSFGIAYAVNLLFGQDTPAETNGGGSPTYGWSGIRNTTTQGTPVPKIYGKHRVAGHVINAYRRCGSEGSETEQLFLTIAVGSGPIRSINGYTTDQTALDIDSGDSLGAGLRINGLDGDTYRGVQAWYRMGTETQSVLPESLRVGVQSREVDDPITIDAASGEWQHYTTSGRATGAYLNLRFDRGLFDQSSGSIANETITIQIQWRTVGGSWLPVNSGEYDFTNNSVSAFTRSIFALDLVGEPAYLEFRYRRETAAANDNRIGDSVRLQDVAEVTGEDGGRYPGIALAAFVIDATERLRGNLPNVTSLVEGSYVPVIATAKDGDLAEPVISYEYSRNPAWIALDILLDRDNGLGNFISAHDIDGAAWLEWALWCDEVVIYQEDVLEPLAETDATEAAAEGATSIVLTADESDFPAGTVVRIEYDQLNYVIDTTDLGGGRTQLDLVRAVVRDYPEGFTLYAVELTDTIQGARHRCDIVFDAEGNAWEAVKTVMKTGRAVPAKFGDRIKPRYEGLASPVQHIAEANMVADTMRVTYIGKAERADFVEVQYLDRQLDYDQAVELVGDTPSNLDRAPVRKTIQLRGITESSHARREAAFYLRQGKLTRKKIEFEMAADGIASEVGDVISISAVMPAWTTLSSRASGTLASFALDHRLVLESGTTYTVVVVTSSAPEGVVATITSTAGTYDPGDTITSDGAGIVLDQAICSIGEFGEVTEDFRIARMEVTEDLTVAIEAIQYVPEIYDLPGWTLGEIEVETDPECLEPGMTYFLSFAEVAATCPDCAAYMGCAGGEECEIEYSNLSVTPDAAAFACLTFKEISFAGMTVQVDPGCGETEVCIDVSFTVTRLCCPTGCRGCFCTVGDQCVASDTLCFDICT